MEDMSSDMIEMMAWLDHYFNYFGGQSMSG